MGVEFSCFVMFKVKFHMMVSISLSFLPFLLRSFHMFSLLIFLLLLFKFLGRFDDELLILLLLENLFPILMGELALGHFGQESFDFLLLPLLLILLLLLDGFMDKVIDFFSRNAIILLIKRFHLLRGFLLDTLLELLELLLLHLDFPVLLPLEHLLGDQALGSAQ